MASPGPLHPAADDENGNRSRETTAAGPDPGPVRSITRGEAEDPQAGRSGVNETRGA